MKETIRQIIKSLAHIEIPANSIDDDTDLYEAGLSSLNMIQLMLAVEKRFNIEIPDRMLNRQLFESINSLARAVATLQESEEKIV